MQNVYAFFVNFLAEIWGFSSPLFPQNELSIEQPETRTTEATDKKRKPPSYFHRKKRVDAEKICIFNLKVAQSFSFFSKSSSFLQTLFPKENLADSTWNGKDDMNIFFDEVEKVLIERWHVHFSLNDIDLKSFQIRELHV